MLMNAAALLADRKYDVTCVTDVIYRSLS